MKNDWTDKTIESDPIDFAIGLFVPMMRELGEMAYQWDEPFIVDDSRFREHFPARPAALDEAARATVEWARATYTTWVMSDVCIEQHR